MIDVSFIIPAFNAEKTIERCIKSVYNIDEYNIEIILIDDGSVDNTSKICEKFLTDTKFKYIKQNNKGVAEARNTGILNSSGKYLFFLDSDDEVIDKYIKKQISETIKNDADWSASGYMVISQKSKKECPLSYNESNNELNGLDNIVQGYVWGKLYKSEIIKKNSLVFDKNMSFAEDMLFNLRYSLYVEKCISIPECCYCYYLYNNSLSRKYCKNYLESMLKVQEAFSNLFNKYPNYKSVYESKYGSIKLGIINGYIRNEFRNSEYIKFKTRISFIKRKLELLDTSDVDKNYVNGLYNKLSFTILKTKSAILICSFFSIINFIKG